MLIFLKETMRNFALVLDLDECLIRVHGNKLYIRPFCIKFLQLMRPWFFPIIIFTNATHEWAMQSILLAGLERYVDHVLSRKQCQISQRKYRVLKSWEMVRQNLPKNVFKQGILVDNIPSNGFNGGYYRVYGIKNFEGEKDDREFLFLYTMIGIDLGLPLSIFDFCI